MDGENIHSLTKLVQVLSALFRPKVILFFMLPIVRFFHHGF